MNSRRLLALALLTVCGALLVPSSASAYDLQKFRLWDRKTVTYKVADTVLSSDMKGVVGALRRQAGIRLVRPRDGERAGITITRTPEGSCLRNGVAGVTTTSLTVGPGGREAQATVRVGSDCKGIERYLILAHEVGHALGLDHEDGRCALMNRAVKGSYPYKCSDPRQYEWRLKPFRPDDVAGLKARFRGLPR